MSKLDGLVWKKGDDGWKDIPTGIGYSGTTFDPTNDIAVVRTEIGAQPGFGGSTIDFTKPNDLETAIPADTDLNTAPKVQWAGVHPTNLEAAIILWSKPVIILDPTKIVGGNNPSLNGRVMTVVLEDNVKIDGSDNQQVIIQANAVGAYGRIADPDQVDPTSGSTGMYPGTNNDSSIGTDQPSQTAGQQIPLFVPNQQQVLQVKCVYTYKVEDAIQICGEPHKIWGACYCIWGSTSPLGVFPFGQTVSLNPAVLVPKNSKYGGTINAVNFVDRGQSCTIAISGVSGPVILLATKDDSELPFQPGAFVAFESYLCDTICGTAKMTKITDMDESLAYVDEDIIKPSEITLPLHTFIETTYFRTSINAITTLTLSSFFSTEYFTTVLHKIWRDTQVYGTAVLWTPDLTFPEGDVTSINGVVQDGEALKFSSTDLKAYAPLVQGSDFSIGAVDPTPQNILLDTPALKAVSARSDVVASKAPTGSQAVVPPLGTTVLVRTPFSVNGIAAGSVSVTSVDKTSATFSTVSVTFCLDDGSSTTLDVLVASGAVGSMQIVTNVGTAASVPTTLTYLSNGGDVTVVTSITLTDFVTTTAHSIATAAFNTLEIFPPTAPIGVAFDAGFLITNDPPLEPFLRTSEVTVFKVTGSATPGHVDLTKFSDLVDITEFAAAGVPLDVLVPSPVPLYLAQFDPAHFVPILDTTGTDPVKLLISDINGTLTLVGAIPSPKVPDTVRTPPAVCVVGPVAVVDPPGADYWDPGTMVILAGIPSKKPLGNAEACPCYTTQDPDGGPSPPRTDNDIISDKNPCTIRVRRLQLKACHRSA